MSERNRDRKLVSTQVYAAIVGVARHKRMSMRDVAKALRIQPSTLTRLSQGHSVDADTLVTILDWLGYDVPFTAGR